MYNLLLYEAYRSQYVQLYENSSHDDCNADKICFYFVVVCCFLFSSVIVVVCSWVGNLLFGKNDKLLVYATIVYITKVDFIMYCNIHCNSVLYLCFFIFHPFVLWVDCMILCYSPQKVANMPIFSLSLEFISFIYQAI